jgi:hypothetical protein
MIEILVVMKLGVLTAKVVEFSGTAVVTVGMLVLSPTVVAVLSTRVVMVASGLGRSSKPLFSSMKGRLALLRVIGSGGSPVSLHPCPPQMSAENQLRLIVLQLQHQPPLHPQDHCYLCLMMPPELLNSLCTGFTAQS